ncbi:MAG TPA: hypothetical protein VN720_11940 [Rudaea sp.]|jgi:hypothetical protein|nr:hypothetical protein [Rudaea sp.]
MRIANRLPLLALLPLAVAAADPLVIETADNVPRHPSGMALPEQVAGFVRKKLLRFDESGSDAGASYAFNDAARSILATVYIYPPPGGVAPADALERNMLCSQELDKRKDELHRFHPDSTLSPVKPATLTQTGTSRSGYHIAFNSYEQFGASAQNVSSDFYLFCFAMEDWMLAYRFTYPAKTDVAGQIAQFMRDLAWAR